MSSRRAACGLAAIAAAGAITIAAAGLTLHGQARGKPPQVTAKAQQKETTAAAKKWRADAILIQIASSLVGANGTTSSWDFGFWSASAKTCAVISIYPGYEARPRESGGPTCQSGELTTFIDSDQALKSARAAGITTPTVSMVVSTTISKDGKSSVWMVRDDKPGTLMVTVDGTTGTLLEKMKQ